MKFYTYHSNSLGDIRTVIDKGTVWFFVIDLVNILNIRPTNVTSILNSKYMPNGCSKKFQGRAWIVTKEGARAIIERRLNFVDEHMVASQLLGWIEGISLPLKDVGINRNVAVSVREMAKDMNVGCRTLYRKLLADHFVEPDSGLLLPTLNSRTSGIMVIAFDDNGPAAFITEKGREYFAKKYANVG